MHELRILLNVFLVALQDLRIGFDELGVRRCPLLNLRDPCGVGFNTLCVALGGCASGIQTTGEELCVGGDAFGVELRDALVAFHDPCVHRDQLSIETGHNRTDLGQVTVELGAVLQVINLCLVEHGMNPILLHLVRSINRIQDGRSVSEDLVSVEIGQLAITPEGCQIVPQECITIFLNHRTMLVGQKLVVHNYGLQVVEILLVCKDFCRIGNDGLSS
mmetsp:Transcript_15437/g.38819  ORF Transcript_15437/g.38819 Transcript_15437/m.38819 type:complete len:218 (-) Transcript_15437:61-714(-)